MLTVVLSVFVLLVAAPALAADRYVSPTGSGSTCSSGSRCTMATALGQAVAGDTIHALAGTIDVPLLYKGASHAIIPSTGRNGTSTARITVTCETDGGCLLDGEFARAPIRLNGNDYWTIEGFNAKNGNPTVFYIPTGAGSDNGILRRVVLWDARIDQNASIAGIHGGNDWLFEDVAAFGTGRKIISPSQGGNRFTCRRCWSRWEGSISGSPLGSTIVYNTNGPALWEDSLFTWSGESMPNNYVTATNPAGTSMTNFQPLAPGAALSNDRLSEADPDGPPHRAFVTVRGVIVYTKSTDTLPTTSVGGTPSGILPRLWFFGLSNLTLSDIVQVISPSHSRFNSHWGIALTRTPHNSSAAVVDNTATRLTSIRGSIGDTFHTDWDVEGVSAGTSLAAVQSPWQTTSTIGARVCKMSGTTTPLWPWPMNDRIKAATSQAGAYGNGYSFAVIGCNTSGGDTNCKNANGTPFTFPARTETDVTSDIQTLLGTIPSGCRSDTPPPTDPPTVEAPSSVRAPISDRPSPADRPTAGDRPATTRPAP